MRLEKAPNTRFMLTIGAAGGAAAEIASAPIASGAEAPPAVDATAVSPGTPLRAPTAAQVRLVVGFRAAALFFVLAVGCGGAESSGDAAVGTAGLGASATDTTKAGPSWPAIPCEQSDLDYELLAHEIAEPYGGCAVDEDCVDVGVYLDCPNVDVGLQPCGVPVAKGSAQAFLLELSATATKELCTAERAPCFGGAGCGCTEVRCVDLRCATVPAEKCE